MRRSWRGHPDCSAGASRRGHARLSQPSPPPPPHSGSLPPQYPLDTLKVRCQLSRRSPLVELRTLGARKLYAGCAATAAGASLFGGVYMLAYQAFQRRALRLITGCKAGEEWEVDTTVLQISAVAATSAVLANCCTALVEVPLDTARQRLQAGVAQGSLVSLMASSARLGPRSLYNGLFPFLLRTVPMDALQFAVYELLQSVRWQRDERARKKAAAAGRELPTPAFGEAVTDMALGGLAGGISAFLTMPLDTIKTHINCGPQGGSIISVSRAIWAASGPRGFFAGTSSRLLERVPSCAVYWLAAEATRRCLAPEDEPEPPTKLQAAQAGPRAHAF